jgi:hypothetical protein
LIKQNTYIIAPEKPNPGRFCCPILSPFEERLTDKKQRIAISFHFAHSNDGEMSEGQMGFFRDDYILCIKETLSWRLVSFMED